MRILHCVETYFPRLGGMQEVVKQLSERLVQFGHEVTVATSFDQGREKMEKDGVRIIEFKISGNSVIGIEGDAAQYQQFLLESNFDVVTFFAAQQWATDLALPILNKIKGKKISVPTGFPGLFWPEYKKYFAEMANYMLHFDMHVFLSEDYKDIHFAKKSGVKNYRIIANGADEKEFSQPSPIEVRKHLGIPKNKFLILHVGSFTGFKGHLEAIDLFLRMAKKNATLLMIGNNSEHFRIPRRRPFLWLKFRLSQIFFSKKIIFKGFSREFTVAAYQQSDLFLFPSNIECSPIVLFECAAAGLPFLATNAGNAKEIAEWTGGGKILPTFIDHKGFSHARIRESVKMLEQFIGDGELRKEMSHRGRSAWQKNYTWNAIAKSYEQLYSEITGKI